MIKTFSGSELLSSMWFVYTVMVINLIVIWLMPKRLSRKEIYVTWTTTALLNLSTDIILDLYFKMYELEGSEIQLSVHIIELTLGPSSAIIFLNFMPSKFLSFVIYSIAWVAYSLIIEAISVHFHFVNYIHWKLWYSALVYLLVFLFLRWHLRFIRKNIKS